MPTIPKYNQGATEEAGLTRAKKRVIRLMEQGILQLTESPAVDLTEGKADVLAENIIKLMERISTILKQSNLYFEELGDVVIVEKLDDVKKVMEYVLTARSMMRRLRRAVVRLSSGITYIDLRLFDDLKSAWIDLQDVLEISLTYLQNIDVELVGDDDASDRERERLAKDLTRLYFGDDRKELEADQFMYDIEDEEIERQIERRNITQENFSKVPNFEDLVMELYNLSVEIGDMLEKMTTNFNEARQQKVFAPERVADELTGSGFRKPIYRIGNNVMNAMYEMDGLPRYI